MEKLDNRVAEYIEQRLLQPERLEQLLSHVLDRRTERAESRTLPTYVSARPRQTPNSSDSMTPSRMASPICPTPC
jgi:hypothetical protein